MTLLLRAFLSKTSLMTRRQSEEESGGETDDHRREDLAMAKRRLRALEHRVGVPSWATAVASARHSG